MKDIQIFLSTYNGERYLREQLDSFVGLSNFDRVKVLMHIRPDGDTVGSAAGWMITAAASERRRRYEKDQICNALLCVL